LAKDQSVWSSSNIETLVTGHTQVLLLYWGHKFARNDVGT
jgi:hypothetical protein